MSFVRKDLKTLSSDDLHRELDPARITHGLRWTPDIAYQGEVAKSIVQMMSSSSYQLPQGLSYPLLHSKLALAFCEIGDYEKAVLYSQYALNQLHTVSDVIEKRIIAATCYHCIGVKHREPLDVTQSLAALDAGLGECNGLDVAGSYFHASIKANLLRNKGLTYLAAKRFNEAFKCFVDCFEVIHRHPNAAAYKNPVLTYCGLAQVLEGEATKNIAAVSAGFDYYLRAEKGYAAQPDFAQMPDSCEDYGSFTAHMAKGYLLLDEFQRAIDWYNKAYQIRKHMEAEPGQPQGQHGNRVADVYTGLGRAYLGLGDLANANTYFTKALTLNRRLPMVEQSKIDAIQVFLDKVAQRKHDEALRTDVGMGHAQNPARLNTAAAAVPPQNPKDQTHHRVFSNSNNN